MPIQATKVGTACFLGFGFWILDSGFWILDSGFCTLRHSTLTIQSAGQEDCTAPGTPRRCRPTCELVTRLCLAGGRKLGDLGVEAVADPRAGLSSNPFMPSGRAWRQEPSYDGYHYADTP